MSEQLVPEIRVAGFDDEWINRPFDQLVHRRSSIVTSEGLPQVEYEDIESGFGRLNRDLRTKTSHKSGIAFEPGDVVFGKLRPYLKNWLRPEFEGLAVGDFWVLVPDTCTTSFLYALIQAPRFTEASSISSGSKMPRSDWPLVSQARFAAPQNHEEHELIGGTFHRLERLINDHRNKHRKLQQAKASLMQRMFPAPGANEPEIRLEGFSGKWEQRRLGDVATFINGRAYSQPELLSHGKYPVLRVGNFYTNSAWYYSDLELNEKCYANTGDLLYTWSASFGPHIWTGGKVIFHYHIWRVELSNALDKLFALQLLEKHRDSILAGHNGSTMAHITKEGMEDKSVLLAPSVAEQQAVGAFFSKLDDLIEAQAQYVSKLQQVKAALLQKMFI